MGEFTRGDFPDTAGDTTLYSKGNQASDLWQQPQLASDFNWLIQVPDLWETVDWGKKWFVDFNAGKTKLVLFDQSSNTGSIDVKNGWVCWGKIIFSDAGVDLLF